MSTSYFCPNCHSKQSVDHLHPGEQALCRQCNSHVIVPKEDGSVAEAVATAPRGARGADLLPPSPVLIQQVQSELDRLDQPKSTLGRGLAILIISALAFVGFVSVGSTIEFVGVLLVVLLVHELGHLVGMKLFGYKDLQMLFIPLLGAAVSGRTNTPRAVHQGMVSLLGPLPGILLGILAFVVNFRIQSPLLLMFATTSIFINLFNLMPLYPLDGGRLLQHALFTRLPLMRLVFQVVTVGLLGLLAAWSRSIVIGVFALFMLMTIAALRADIRALRKLREQFGDAGPELDLSIAVNYLEFLIPNLMHQPGHDEARPKLIAAAVRRVWDDYRLTPPGSGAALFLMLIYAAGLFIGLVAFAVVSGRYALP